MKIVIDSAIPFIKDRFPENLDIVYCPGDKITAELVSDADAVVVRTRTRCDESLLKGSSVKVVATATIGNDHIDLSWCENHGITVRNAPGCNAPGVAQYVLASLIKTGFNPERDLLGIIGYGHVGSIVAKWAMDSGINVLVSDAPRRESGYSDVKYYEMNDVLKKADAVTLHVPLKKDGLHPTFHLIGDKQLALMKPGAILVNSSRGGVVDEISLKKAIKAGKIKAVVDVWENEPYIDRELAQLADISTPHIAGYSLQGKMRATRMVLEAISETMSIPVDLTGLECEVAGDKNISIPLIERSYNPLLDSQLLLKDPGAFENLRNHYPYRAEPQFL